VSEPESKPALTGRQIVMVRLGKAVSRATAGEILRAAAFLEFAYDCRKGCQDKRRQSRARRNGS
jgi:hypothetical protein